MMKSSASSGLATRSGAIKAAMAGRVVVVRLREDAAELLVVAESSVLIAKESGDDDFSVGNGRELAEEVHNCFDEIDGIHSRENADPRGVWFACGQSRNGMDIQ